VVTGDLVPKFQTDESCIHNRPMKRVDPLGIWSDEEDDNNTKPNEDDSDSKEEGEEEDERDEEEEEEESESDNSSDYGSFSPGIQKRIERSPEIPEFTSPVKEPSSTKRQ
jgi:hypothetical protein